MADITVIVPSYNHGRFLLEAVASVLHQSVAPHEIIVVDDASLDDSVARLRELGDPRVRLLVQPTNRGGSETLNAGIRASSGDFIAICNSDDLWEHDKLERQLSAFERDPTLGAVFTDVSWIGERGQAVSGHGNLFRVANRPRHGWIRHLAERGNCLCHPSVLIRREAYSTIGDYDNRLRQLPDFKMWIQLACHFDIHVLDDRLVRYRIHDNTSKRSPSAVTRDRNEFTFIIYDLMSKISIDNFCPGFGCRLDPADSRFDLAVEKILYLWSVEGQVSPMFRSVANRLAMELLGSAEGENAWARYGFSMRDFHTLHGLTSAGPKHRAREKLSPDELDVLSRLLARPASSDIASARDPGMDFTSPTATFRIKRELSRIKRQAATLLSGHKGPAR